MTKYTTKYILSSQGFKKLVRGETAKLGDVELALEDIGFDQMFLIVQQAAMLGRYQIIDGSSSIEQRVTALEQGLNALRDVVKRGQHGNK